MELGDYLRIIGRRWWLIAAVTVLAAVLMAILYPPDDRYVTAATVQVDTENMSSNDRLDFIANFQAALGQSSVRETVSEDLELEGFELSPTEINARVSAERAGGGATFVRLRDESESADADESEALVRLMAAEAVEFVNLPRIQVLQGEVDRVREQLDVARADVEAARGSVDVAIEEAGGVDPATTYANLQSLVQTLQLTLVIADDAATRNEISDSLADANEQLPQAARDAQSYEELLAAQEIAENSRAGVFNDLDRAESNLRQATTPPSVVFQRVSVETAGSPSMAQRIVAAAVVGFLLSSGLVLAVDIQRQRRQPQLRRRDDQVLGSEIGEPVPFDRQDLVDETSPYPDDEYTARDGAAPEAGEWSDPDDGARDHESTSA